MSDNGLEPVDWVYLGRTLFVFRMWTESSKLDRADATFLFKFWSMYVHFTSDWLCRETVLLNTVLSKCMC